MIQSFNADNGEVSTWNDATGRFIRTSNDGSVLEDRPLTDDEVTRLAARAASQQLTANRAAIEAAIDSAIEQLDALIAAPPVDDVPAGTLTTAQLSNVARQMRDFVQQNRAGAQQVALILKRTIRLVRGDYTETD